MRNGIGGREKEKLRAGPERSARSGWCEWVQRGKRVESSAAIGRIAAARVSAPASTVGHTGSESNGSEQNQGHASSGPGRIERNDCGRGQRRLSRHRFVGGRRHRLRGGLSRGLGRCGLGERDDVGAIRKVGIGDFLGVRRRSEIQSSSESGQDQLPTNHFANFHKAPRFVTFLLYDRRE